MREQLVYAKFAELGITHETIYHPPVETVEAAMKHVAATKGTKCKNLLLKDKTGILYLLIASIETTFKINALAKTLSLPSLKMAEQTVLDEIGVQKGAITPFLFVLLKSSQQIVVLLDRAIPETQPVCFHPLRNDATTIIAHKDLLTFLSSFAPLIRIFPPV